jgi:hypothetical protein
MLRNAKTTISITRQMNAQKIGYGLKGLKALIVNGT